MAAQSTASGSVNQMSEADYAEEAPIKYDSVRFWMNKRVRISDLYSPQGKLLNEGKITLSYKKGDLALDEYTNPTDFEVDHEELKLQQQAELAAQQQQQMDLDARRRGAHKKPHSHHQRKYKPRKHRKPRRDLFKSAHLREFHTNWNGPLGVQLDTVRTLDGEGFHLGSGVVTKTFAANVMSATEARDYLIRERPVNVGQAIFNNLFDGVTVETYKKAVTPLPQTKEFLVPLHSPWTMYHNAHEPLSEHYLAPSAGFESKGLIVVPADKYRKYETITDKEMHTKLSFADITDDFQVTFFVPAETGVRINEHAKFLETGQGMPWDNFADFKSQLPLSKLETISSLGASALNAAKIEHDNREIVLQGYLQVKYLHCDGRKIAMDTRRRT